MAHKFGRGLVSLGAKAGDKVKLFADTKLEWQVTAQACFHQGIVVSTSYANLGQEALVYAINQTEAAIVCTDATLVGMLASVLDQCPTVKHIIYYEDARPTSFEGRLNDDKLQQIVADTAGDIVALHSMNDVIQLGEANTDVSRPAVKGEDLAVIMYTSGSTGLPKGVMIANKNLVAGMAGVTAMIPGMGVGDYYVAYLPLAHILEMIAEAGEFRLVCHTISANRYHFVIYDKLDHLDVRSMLLYSRNRNNQTFINTYPHRHINPRRSDRVRNDQDHHRHVGWTPGWFVQR
jgi:long-chain acyl-CoA synthetase